MAAECVPYLAALAVGEAASDPLEVDCEVALEAWLSKMVVWGV